MKFFLNLGMLVLFLGNVAFAQSRIKTVQCYPVGRPFAEPVIELGSGEQIYFCFDDLAGEAVSYTYKIVHCDPDWNSSNLSAFTYLNGFFSNPLEDYNYSFNTTVPYVRYVLYLPNEEVSMKLSGNYLLQVFGGQNLDSAVLEQRFSVVESKAGIVANVSTATDPASLYTSQQVNFVVNYGSLQIYNPIRDTRLYVTQNQDPNTRVDFKPTFVRQNQLVYGNGRDNVFNGLSPFRNFQSSSLVYYTRYVKDVLKGPDGKYHVILVPGVVPSRYVPTPDRDGNFFVEAENVQDSDLEADYVIVHFALLYSDSIPDADVYVYGKFAGWQCLPELKMAYDSKNKAYVGEVELKQGYYDYMFAVAGQGKETINLTTMQNNFYQPPNEYNIRFYYYDYNLMCFRLLAYKTIGGKPLGS